MSAPLSAVQTRAMGGALAWTVAAASTEVQDEAKKGWVPETTFLLSETFRVRLRCWRGFTDPRAERRGATGMRTWPKLEKTRGAADPRTRLRTACTTS